MGKKRSSKIQSYETSEYVLQHPVAETRTNPGVEKSIAAVAGGIVALAAIGLLAHLSLGASVSGIEIAPTPELASAWVASDGYGISIDNGGVSKSDTITISDYFSGGYTTKLDCTIDSYPVYCDSSPFSIYGLPDGEHTIEMTETGTAGKAPLSFSWIIS
ncbi:MAG: hypothetical protein MN733_43960 [Nitrososphaera sp.]|nr:hypothetical protein [Nitrososphaera sp.]